MNKKMILIISLVFLFLLGAGGAGFYILVNKLNPPAEQNGEAATEGGTGGAVGEDDGEMGHIFSLKPFIVNLADPGGKRYLRVTMQLEVPSEDDSAELSARLPQIRDCILEILPSKLFVEIQAAKGKTLLREELIAKLNSVLRKTKVNKIYFTEFVVQ